MTKIVFALVVLLVSPAALATDLVDMVTDSTNAAYITGNTGFLTDDILLVQTANKGYSTFQGWVWPVFEVTLGPGAPVNLTTADELLLDIRYHQEDYTWDADANPETPDITRTAYTDANVWLLLADSDGTTLDLGWGESWTQDEWKTQVKDLKSLSVPGDFDLTQVSKLIIRSTDWDVPIPHNDYFNMVNVTITEVPEPATLSLLGLGAPLLLFWRRKR